MDKIIDAVISRPNLTEDLKLQFISHVSASIAGFDEQLFSFCLTLYSKNEMKCAIIILRKLCFLGCKLDSKASLVAVMNSFNWFPSDFALELRQRLIDRCIVVFQLITEAAEGADVIPGITFGPNLRLPPSYVEDMQLHVWVLSNADKIRLCDLLLRHPNLITHSLPTAKAFSLLCLHWLSTWYNDAGAMLLVPLCVAQVATGGLFASDTSAEWDETRSWLWTNAFHQLLSRIMTAQPAISMRPPIVLEAGDSPPVSAELCLVLEFMHHTKQYAPAVLRPIISTLPVDALMRMCRNMIGWIMIPKVTVWIVSTMKTVLFCRKSVISSMFVKELALGLASRLLVDVQCKSAQLLLTILHDVLLGYDMQADVVAAIRTALMRFALLLLGDLATSSDGSDVIRVDWNACMVLFHTICRRLQWQFAFSVPSMPFAMLIDTIGRQIVEKGCLQRSFDLHMAAVDDIVSMKSQQISVVCEETSDIEEAICTSSHHGFVNNGNTCFMNSILQALYHTSEFSKEMLKMPLVEHASNAAGSSVSPPSKMLVHLQRIVALMVFGLRPVIDPILFQNTLPAWLNEGRQQDASEFMRFLLEQLATQHEMEGRMNEMFAGETMTVIRSMECPHVSSTAQPFLELSLAFPPPSTPDLLPLPPIAADAGSAVASHTIVSETPSGPLSLEAMIRNISHEETMAGDEQYFCDSCACKRVAVRKEVVTKFPAHLVLTLKRFKYIVAKNKFEKIVSPVAYPSVLVLDSGVRYMLYAVVLHIGSSPLHGHYYSYARHSSPAFLSVAAKDSTWWKCNDDRLSVVSEADVLSYGAVVTDATPYLLFYRRLCEDDSDAKSGEVTITAAEIQSSLFTVASFDNRDYLNTLDLHRT